MIQKVICRCYGIEHFTNLFFLFSVFRIWFNYFFHLMKFCTKLVMNKGIILIALIIVANISFYFLIFYVKNTRFSYGYSCVFRLEYLQINSKSYTTLQTSISILYIIIFLIYQICFPSIIES